MIWQYLPTHRGLLLERPTGNSTDPLGDGDQGLFIKRPQNKGTALKIAHSAVANMAHSGILHEDLEFMKHPKLQVFEPDYANGKGIFIRGLIHVSVAEPGNPFAAFIKQNASAVWCNRPDKDTNQFAYNWNGAAGYEPTKLKSQGNASQALCNLVMQAAGQDALNAAMWIAPNEQIPGS